MFKKKTRQELNTHNIVDREEYIDEDNYKGNINDIFRTNNMNNKDDTITKRKRIIKKPSLSQLTIPFNDIIAEDNTPSPSSSIANKRTRVKSEYHTFVKEKVEFLKIHSPEIIGRDRFRHAIELWNEVKNVKNI
jgi:hypothetical protein